MTRIEDDCVGCGIYCCDCGLKHAEHLHCDRCDSEEQLFAFNDGEFCEDCISAMLDKEKTETGVCENCGEEYMVYSGYGLCEECLWETLETVEGSEV